MVHSTNHDVIIDESSKQLSSYLPAFTSETGSCRDHSADILHVGLFPYGLKSSSGIFQSFMNKTLNGIDNVFIYSDDVLIFSSTLEDHKKTLREVLQALKNASIKLNIW